MLELSSKLGKYMYELLACSFFLSLLFVLLLACFSFFFFFFSTLLFVLFNLPMKFKTVFSRHWVLNFHENFSMKPKPFSKYANLYAQFVSVLKPHMGQTVGLLFSG